MASIGNIICSVVLRDTSNNRQTGRPRRAEYKVTLSSIGSNRFQVTTAWGAIGARLQTHDEPVSNGISSAVDQYRKCIEKKTNDNYVHFSGDLFVPQSARIQFSSNQNSNPAPANAPSSTQPVPTTWTKLKPAPKPVFSLKSLEVSVATMPVLINVGELVMDDL